VASPSADSGFAGTIKVQFGFAYVYGILAVALAVSAFAAGLLGPWKVQPRPVTVVRTVSPSSAAAVAKGWGQPDEQVAGASVNSAFAGLTCDLWTAKSAVLCF